MATSTPVIGIREEVVETTGTGKDGEKSEIVQYLGNFT